MTVSADHPSRTHRREWRLLREAVLERAGHRCEVCRAPNHRPISRHRDDPGHYKLLDTGDEFDADGQPAPAQRLSEYDGLPGVGVVLTLAHLDAPGGPCRCSPPCLLPEHVLALCQRCHLRYDAARHRRTAARTRRRAAGTLTLPGMEPEP